MPIQVAGKLIPRNDNTWPVVDDAHIEGGYRVVADLLARNAIDVTTLKVGAAVHVVASQATYRVASIVEGVVTWEDFFPAVPYDIAAPTFGKPAASEVVMRLTTQRAFSVQSAAAKATTAATVSTAVFTVAKNGASIGTLTFAVSGTVATSTVPVTAFAVNDVLTITAPGTQNATLADIDFFVKGQVAG